MAFSEDLVRAYRIVAPRWVASAFSGEGARRHGGRWNSPGRPLVYLAGSPALAALEMLVHLPSPGSRAKPYRILEASIPQVCVKDMASTGSTVSAGDAWIDDAPSLALRVTSMLIPEEPNYLINPAHPDLSRIRIGEAVEFRFDQRL